MPADDSGTPFGGPPDFEIFEWYPAYASCQKYFLDHAQHDYSVQAVAALVNISLPHQWMPHPVLNSSGAAATAPLDPLQDATAGLPNDATAKPARVSLIPYIRRLVVTGFDKEAVLHGFFGDDWRKGVGPQQECERRNYLFAAKSGGWAKVKAQYDMNDRETVPWLQPPHGVDLVEIENAEKLWSQWLALEDWMVGPRAPEVMGMYARGDVSARPAGP